jgi:predicted patatin/cPLA2 family phospholipase
MDFDNIDKEIKEFENKKNVILDIVKEYQKNIDDIDKKIKNLYKLFPRCYSCGKHFHPKKMTIATQEDVNERVDRNDGYYGPEVGEYYCGWC